MSHILLVVWKVFRPLLVNMAVNTLKRVATEVDSALESKDVNNIVQKVGKKRK
ncbi:hypothetical protein AGMMS50229_18620 [Campylobacterota bacterium]|nr:hypothetical protein AGMMS50229_18620 [Campylobacterota bacterium]